jgi:hypothetical protein
LFKILPTKEYFTSSILFRTKVEVFHFLAASDFVVSVKSPPFWNDDVACY